MYVNYDGWLRKLKNPRSTIKNYYKVRDILSICKGVLLFNDRAVILNKLHEKLLVELHKEYMGIVKTKMLAKDYVWWPNLNYQIENMILNCKSCLIQVQVHHR
jgi:hypothetical protein